MSTTQDSTPGAVSAAQHTPGPWVVRGDPGYTYVAGGSPLLPICDVAMSRPASGDDWHRANARLIAAAPELLNALRNLLGVAALIDVEKGAGAEEADAARAAIAKATANA